MDYFEIVEALSHLIETIGLAVIVIGSVWSLAYFILSWINRHTLDVCYAMLRQNLARTIILGLEFLIAGDIIHSIAVTPSYQSVIILGMIVLIRTFLSIELQKEVDGFWPWQKKDKK
jgi:uncharacterized membrane protein